MLEKMYSTGIILLFAIYTLSAAQIEGFWKVNKSNDLIEIRSTSDGIKAKFVDSNEWDYYERLRGNLFEDRKGNRYIVKSSNRIQWQSRDGRRTIKLNRDQGYRSGSYGYEHYEYDKYERKGRNDYGGDNYAYDEGNCTSSCRTNCSVHRQGKFNGRNSGVNALSGTWVNRWRNTIAYVEYDGFLVSVCPKRNLDFVST